MIEIIIITICSTIFYFWQRIARKAYQRFAGSEMIISGYEFALTVIFGVMNFIFLRLIETKELLNICEITQ